ncbi:MAG: hypothetical protein IKZ05_01785 [Clostridia bacterium]|nr:hypothetical protein [Clostridia bacterium]
MLDFLQLIQTLRNVLYAIIGLVFLIAPIVWFVVSIVAFNKSKFVPDTRKTWRGNLIASSIVLGVEVLFICFILLIVRLAQDVIIYM